MSRAGHLNMRHDVAHFGARIMFDANFSFLLSAFFSILRNVAKSTNLAKMKVEKKWVSSELTSV